MEEIYWITRLDGINISLNVMTVLGIILTVISIVGYIVTKDDDYVDDCWKELWIKLFKYCFPTTIIITLLFIFTPTTKEALMIWGVGELLIMLNLMRQLNNYLISALKLLTSGWKV